MKTLDPEETRQALADYGLDRPRGLAFAFDDPARNVAYDWHSHPYHQLIHAMRGATWIETASGRHVLPAGRAAWIPAGTRHRTLIGGDEGASLYFSPQAVADASGRIRILIAGPMMREMILYAMRWPLGAGEDDPLAVSFFHTLSLLCRDWLQSELPLFLPRADHPAIVRAMDRASADPGAATLATALDAARMAERSFRRLFRQQTGMSWQAWRGQLRLLHAMGALCEGQRITDVAADAGYNSLSAFAKAFTRLTGESPSDFRRRHRG